MDEHFVIRIMHKGKPVELQARLSVQGYMHRFYVQVDGSEYIFELDDNREYRAMLNGQHDSNKHIDTSLLQAIIAYLVALQQ